MIISVANQRGGIAKSTTAINLSAGLTFEGYKVLLIDTDAQAPRSAAEAWSELTNGMRNQAPLAFRRGAGG